MKKMTYFTHLQIKEKDTYFSFTTVKLWLLLTFCMLSNLTIFAQPGDCIDATTKTIVFEDIPVCGTGSQKHCINYTNPNAKCVTFIFKRTTNLSSVQEFSFEIGQGNSCNGALESYSVTPSNAVVSVTQTQGGSQTTATLKFLAGSTQVSFEACGKGRGPHATICNLCKKCGLTGIVCPPAPRTVFDCKNPIPNPITTIQGFLDAGGQINGTPCGQLSIVSATGEYDNCKTTEIKRVYSISDGKSTYKCEIIYKYAPDKTPPEIVIKGSKTDLGCNPTYDEIDKAFGTATATDNCDDYVHLDVWTSETYSEGCKRWKKRTWKAKDRCGNPAEKSVTVYWIYDKEDPKLWVEYDKNGQNIGCNPTKEEIEAAFGKAYAKDNCCEVKPVLKPGDIVVIDECTRKLTRVWYVEDCCGNYAKKEITIYWKFDKTPPDINVYGSKTDLGCNPEYDEIDKAFGRATVKDNCDDYVHLDEWTSEVYSDGCKRWKTRTWKAKDKCGNPAEKSVTVYWLYDKTPPKIIYCPKGGEVECITDIPKPNPWAVKAEDYCSDAKVVDVETKTEGYACNSNYPYKVIYKYIVADKCGNKAYCYETWTLKCPTPGTIPSITKVCGSVYVCLNITGGWGKVIRWEKQVNCTGPWTPISNTEGATSYCFYTTPNTITCYRAVYGCGDKFTNVGRVEADTPAEGGYITAYYQNTELCNGESVKLYAKGQVGRIIGWQSIPERTMDRSIPAWKDIPGTAGVDWYEVKYSELSMAMSDKWYRVCVCSPLGICTGNKALAYSYPGFKVSRRWGCYGTDLLDNNASTLNNNATKSSVDGNNVAPKGDISFFDIPVTKNLIKGRAYPNPSINQVTLDIIGAHEGQAQIEIYDATGKVVLKDARHLNFDKNEVNLDISKLNSGLYFIKFTDSAKEQSTIKIYKQ